MNPNARTISIHRLVLAAAFAAITAGVPAVSRASDALAGRTVTLEFTAASVSTPQGAGMLYQRIRSAAENICSVLIHGDLSSKRNSRTCEHKLIEHAVRNVDRAALTAVFEGNYPPNPARQLMAAQQR